MIMKAFCFKLVLLPLFFCGAVRGTVTIDFQFGELSTSDAVTLPAGTLWAIISENEAGDLPGGLALDGSFSGAVDPQAVLSDFAGATIAPQSQVGGGAVVFTGEVPSSQPGFALGFSNLDFADFSELGLNSGDQLGLYWFPGFTETTNVLPTDSEFEIGGFHRSDASTASGGDTGLVMPPDGQTVTIAFFDSETTGGDTSIDPAVFQAVTVPEPSSSFMAMAVTLFVFVRRRR